MRGEEEENGNQYLGSTETSAGCLTNKIHFKVENFLPRAILMLLQIPPSVFCAQIKDAVNLATGHFI